MSPHAHLHMSPLPPCHIHMCTHVTTEDAYRIEADIDDETVGLDILDTAGQVGADGTGCISLLLHCVPINAIV